MLRSVLLVCLAIFACCNATCLVQDPPVDGESDLFCTLDATAVSSEFQLSTFCENNKEASISILSVKSKEFKVQPLVAECQQKLVGQLFWISLDDFESQIEPALLEVTNQVKKIVARYSLTDEAESALSYCILDTTESPKQCASLENEMDIVEANSMFEVLIERMPLRIEVSNILPGAWNNITNLNETILMDGELKNLDSTDQFIEDHLRFPIQKLIQLNMPTVLENYQVSFMKNGKELLPVNEESQFMEVNMQEVHVIHHLLAHTKIGVTVKGTIVKSTSNTVATLRKIYQTNPLEFEEEQIYLSLTEAYISGIHVVYGEFITIDLNNTNNNTVVEDVDAKQEAAIGSHKEKPSVQLPTQPHPVPFSKVYPEFQTYFIIACIIFFGTVLIGACDVVRQSYKMRQSKNLKKKYFSLRKV